MKTAIPAAVPASPEPLSDGELAQRGAGGDVRELAVRKRLRAGWDCGGDGGFHGRDSTLDDAPSCRVPGRTPGSGAFLREKLTDDVDRHREDDGRGLVAGDLGE